MYDLFLIFLGALIGAISSQWYEKNHPYVYEKIIDFFYGTDKTIQKGREAYKKAFDLLQEDKLERAVENFNYAKSAFESAKAAGSKKALFELGRIDCTPFPQHEVDYLAGSDKMLLALDFVQDSSRIREEMCLRHLR
jgi:hypothetical protein